MAVGAAGGVPQDTGPIHTAAPVTERVIAPDTGRAIGTATLMATTVPRTTAGRQRGTTSIPGPTTANGSLRPAIGPIRAGNHGSPTTARTTSTPIARATSTAATMTAVGTSATKAVGPRTTGCLRPAIAAVLRPVRATDPQPGPGHRPNRLCPVGTSGRTSRRVRPTAGANRLRGHLVDPSHRHDHRPVVRLGPARSPPIVVETP